MTSNYPSSDPTRTMPKPNHRSETNEHENPLLHRAMEGDSEALGMLMQTHHDRLCNIVRFRMDPRLNGRLEPGDVVQETFLEATRRFQYFVDNRKSTFFLWLRFLTLQKLNELHRHHFGVRARDKSREVSLFQKQNSTQTSAQIANVLFDDQTTPSQALVRDEARILIENALGEMDAIDQEVLALRHFEQLSNHEVADALGLDTSAASKRFVRALQRLRKIVDQYGDDV